jgi:hypothetical protein
LSLCEKRARHEWSRRASKLQRYLSFEACVARSVAENLYTGFVLNVIRGPAIRGEVGGERSALMADAAVPQVRRTTPQAAAYWAAAFNGRHHKRRRGRSQPTVI